MARKSVIATIVLVVATLGGGAIHSAQASARTGKAATKSVSIKSYKYKPGTMTVKRGTNVVWTNSDAATHTVSLDSTGKFKLESGDIVNGKHFRKAFTQDGVFRYHCAYHPFMHGTIKVTG